MTLIFDLVRAELPSICVEIKFTTCDVKIWLLCGHIQDHEFNYYDKNSVSLNVEFERARKLITIQTLAQRRIF